MKIISKYKDYYDYLATAFGVDSKIILDRRDHDKYVPNSFYYDLGERGVVSTPDPKMIQLFFCNTVYEGIACGNKIYWGEDRKEFVREDHKKRLFSWIAHNRRPKDPIMDKRHYMKRSYNGITYQGDYLILEPYVPLVDLNRAFNCPILLVDGDYSLKELDYQNDRRSDWFKYPKLDDLHVQDILRPEVAYLTLTEWLSPKDPESEPITDKQKIESKGFDVKRSFRPKMKT